MSKINFQLRRLTNKLNQFSPAYIGVALAQKVTDSPTKPITTAQGVVDAINKVADFLFAVFLALAVVFLIIAALFYLTAAGNQTQLDRSKNVLIYSIVAIVIALVAGGITAFIGNILGTRAL